MNCTTSLQLKSVCAQHQDSWPVARQGLLLLLLLGLLLHAVLLLRTFFLM